MSDLSPAQQMLAALREKFLTQDVPGRIDDIEQLIGSLAEGSDPETSAEAFRKIHSLKGAAGSYRALILTSVCHQLEEFMTSAVDAAGLSPEQVEVGLRYVGLLRDALERLIDGEERFPDIEVELEELRRTAFAAPRSALVVLASRSVGTLALKTLEPLPIQPVLVQDGLTALQRLLHERFDVLITGLQVPDLPGPALIGAVRLAEGVNRNIKTVVVTSRPDASLPAIAQPDLLLSVPELTRLGAEVSALLDL